MKSLILGKIMRISHLLLPLVLLILFVNFGYAKPQLGPPSIQLRSNLANIVSAKLVNISGDYSLSFEKIKDLHNQQNGKIILASNLLISNQLTLGKTYIVAFNKYYIDGFTKKVSLRDGPAIIANIPGAEPAIFSDDEKIIKMFSYSLDESIASPQSMLPILLSGIESNDPRIRHFFITELITRPRLWKELNTTQYLAFFNLIDDVNTAIETKDFMLLHAKFPQGVIKGERFRTYLINPLKHLPVKLDVYSNQASFIRTCLKKLTPLVKDEDKLIIARWLKSNSTAVVENAAKTLHKMSHKQEIKLIKQALSETFLDKKNQKTLNKILNQHN